MPAITAENPLALPRVSPPPVDSTLARPVLQVVNSHRQTEGAGIRIWCPFPGGFPLEAADPFLLLDHSC